LHILSVTDLDRFHPEPQRPVEPEYRAGDEAGGRSTAGSKRRMSGARDPHAI